MKETIASLDVEKIKINIEKTLEKKMKKADEDLQLLLSGAHI
ncbi:hypothetical protein [Candidatus Venteria ishoeyi]|nr:hypothetical protein [Candidatus Venteria ishoeyi]